MDNGGYVDRDGDYVNHGGDAVRPALNLNLTSSYLQAAGTVCSSDVMSGTCIEKGKTYAKGGMRYKVTRVATAYKKGAVTLIKAKNAKKVTVPASVKLADGRDYCVTAVASGAFKGFSKTATVVVGSKVAKISAGAFNNLPRLKSVTLGSGVKKVAKGAFAKTPELRTITVKGRLLKKKSCVRGMLKGSRVKRAVTVKVPKSMRKTYRKVFSKSNLACPKKMVVR